MIFIMCKKYDTLKNMFKWLYEKCDDRWHSEKMSEEEFGKMCFNGYEIGKYSAKNLLISEFCWSNLLPLDEIEPCVIKLKVPNDIALEFKLTWG